METGIGKAVSVTSPTPPSIMKAYGNGLSPSATMGVEMSPFMERTTKMYRAIESHDEETVNRLLCHFQNWNFNNLIPGHALTMLHLAVGLSENHPEIVEKLLKNGGDPNNTQIEEQLSPMHLSVIYDYQEVLRVLMRYGGDPKMVSGDGKSCYDIAKENVEAEMLEKCFLFFYRRSIEFRKSIKPSDKVALSWKENHSQSLSSVASSTSLSEGIFFSCGSELEVQSTSQDLPDKAACDSDGASSSSVNRKLIFHNYSYLMTEDESGDGLSSDDGRLSTIEEESGVSSQQPYQHLPLPHLGFHRTEEEISESDPSCVNSTPPPVLEPTKKEIEKLKDTMKNLCIPVTQSTFGVLNKYTDQKSKLVQVLTPKSGEDSFSSELQMCLENINLVTEWGNLKIDLLQNFTPTKKTSKSFYNYLLLDPKIIKKANFSGNHLKSGVIKNADKFQTFLKSIFYIGKGCGRRPIQHLVDAKATLAASNRKSATGEKSDKIEKILSIWKSGLGVMIVSVFHHSSEREANVSEAAMIDAMGLVELSNVLKGSYAGTIATTWSQKTKNQFGSFLLHKCFCAFAVGDHKSFYPHDI